MRNFVKWDDQPGSVAASVESLIRGYNLVTAEPQGPVYICFDSDIQEQKLTEPFEMPDLSRFPAPTRFQADPEVVGDRDQVALVAFSDDVRELHGLKPMDKEPLKRSISNLNTAGGTQPYQAVALAYNTLFDQGESGRINLIVVMTDELSFDVIEPIFREPDFPVLVYIIGFGADCHPGGLGCLPGQDHVGITVFPGRQVEKTSEPISIKKLFGLLTRFFWLA